MGRLAALAALLALAAPPIAAQAAAPLPLGPGRLMGGVNAYVVKRHDTVAEIASRFGVHPVRVVKPSAKAIADGLQVGETLFVDQRRVEPSFPTGPSGVVLNLPEAEAYLLEGGRVVRRYPVAVSVPDSEWAAPLGSFRVLEKIKDPTWYVPKSIQAEMEKNGQEVKTRVDPGPKNPLGPRWIGFGRGLGLHGTSVPTSIKHYASHGCVRFLKADIIDLFDRVAVGTPVHVTYQPVLLGTDDKTVWLSAYPDFYRRGIDYRAQVKAQAAALGVLPRLSWKAVEKALALKDGIPVDIGAPPAPARPIVTVSPQPVGPAPLFPPSEEPASPPAAEPASPPGPEGPGWPDSGL